LKGDLMDIKVDPEVIRVLGEKISLQNWEIERLEREVKNLLKERTALLLKLKNLGYLPEEEEKKSA